MANNASRDVSRRRRKMHFKKMSKGLEARPRLCVFRSAVHIYAQVIDDRTGTTLAAASTLSPEVKRQGEVDSKVEAAKRVGTLVAERAKAAGLSTVRFDRNGFLYHGRVKALADAAREAGLDF